MIKEYIYEGYGYFSEYIAKARRKKRIARIQGCTIRSCSYKGKHDQNAVGVDPGSNAANYQLKISGYLPRLVEATVRRWYASTVLQQFDN